MKPFLRNKNPVTYNEIPEATAYEAGYLVTKNAGWRNIRPVKNVRAVFSVICIVRMVSFTKTTVR